MAKNLVIVESPAKAKTIEKFLGSDFKVASSFGHISDLPSKDLGVNVDGDFKPKYEISKDKKTVVKNLKNLADKSDIVWLASDEDREGEAIAWHLFRLLKLDENKARRIVFNEITESAIKNAIENPRPIDYNLVDAQQARRVLDRIVGYELSPVLWKKIKSGLSAGRVQSVSVRLIVEKEREIKNFNIESIYRIDAEFKTRNKDIFKAKLDKTFKTKEEAESFLNNNKNSDFSVENLEKKPLKKTPSPPFTTSTLQQEASRKLYFSVSKTMTVAQRLYESGLITYMRTDSVNLSNFAKDSAKKHIISAFGNQYSNTKSYHTKSKGVQDAHEAIRPTNFSSFGDKILDNDQKRLYQLIWKRTIASQMSDAMLEKTNVKIKSSNYENLFIAAGQIVKFDGFLKVYSEGKDNVSDEDTDKWWRDDYSITTIPTSDIDEYAEKYSYTNISHDNDRFEPREQQKGNTARAMFYFYTIYNDEPNVNLDFWEGQEEVLLGWHYNDLPDETEINRSNMIASYQGNNNPYVIDPSLVGRVFLVEENTIPGDMNDDGTLDVIDLIGAINYIIGSTTLDYSFVVISDANYDLSHKIVDVILLVNSILQ